MKKTKYNEDSFSILRVIRYLENVNLEKDDQEKYPPYITTKDLEKELCPDILKVATFYNRFKEIREQGLITSSTNKNHQVVWKINSKGREYMRDYMKEVTIPQQNIMLKDIRSSFLNFVNQYNLTEKEMEYNDLWEKISEDEKQALYYYIALQLKLMTIDKTKPLFNIKIKVDKKIINELLKVNSLR